MKITVTRTITKEVTETVRIGLVKSLGRGVAALAVVDEHGRAIPGGYLLKFTDDGRIVTIPCVDPEIVKGLFGVGEFLGRVKVEHDG